MTTIIDLNDLRHSINRALNLGRYTIVVKTAGADQVPASITLDLLERDDDGFKFRADPEYSEHPVYEQMRAVKGERQRAAMVWHALQLYAHETEAPFPKSTLDWFAQRVGVRLTRSDAVPSDDHGAAIPEQGEAPCGGRVSGPYIYEFTLQEARGAGLTLDNVTMDNAPLLHDCKQADWVHVYDRVTRERRTLKRPEPDAVLTGLRDVAADLRGRVRDAVGKSGEVLLVDGDQCVVRYDDSKWLAIMPTEGMTKADDAMHRAAVEAGYADLGAYVEANTSAADPMPPVGPLTSTEGLKAGDIIRALCDDGCGGWRQGDVLLVARINAPLVNFIDNDGDDREQRPDGFAFVARPGVWMPWEGGENPVPGLWVKVRYDDHPESGPHESTGVVWQRPWATFSPGLNIAAYMVVDTPPASSDT